VSWLPTLASCLFPKIAMPVHELNLLLHRENTSSKER
jgi:hypothetical protein